MTEPHIVADVDPDFLKAFQQVYNVLDVFQFVKFDHDINWLKDRLKQNKKDQYTVNDRIIVVHFDTDYYIQNTFGLNLINFFTLWRELDIPLHTMIFYTNHMGIKQEIENICKNNHENDKPTVIETFINPGNYCTDGWPVEPPIAPEQIEYHGLAMMAGHRSHRFALYNHLKHLSDRLVLVIKGLS